jgi:hypothetical protein
MTGLLDIDIENKGSDLTSSHEDISEEFTDDRSNDEEKLSYLIQICKNMQNMISIHRKKIFLIISVFLFFVSAHFFTVSITGLIKLFSSK